MTECQKCKEEEEQFPEKKRCVIVENFPWILVLAEPICYLKFIYESFKEDLLIWEETYLKKYRKWAILENLLKSERNNLHNFECSFSP